MTKRACIILAVSFLVWLFAAPDTIAPDRMGVHFDSSFRDTLTVPDTSSNFYYENLRLLDPLPDVYFYWARRTVKCLQNEGRNVESTKVKFFLVDSLTLNGAPKAGVYWTGGVVLLKAEHRFSERIVRHEMVHAICKECEHDDLLRLPCTGS